MAFRSIARFKCDGCKIFEKDIEAGAHELLVPPNWLRVETTRQKGERSASTVKHYCTACAPLIENYLDGRRELKVGADE